MSRQRVPDYEQGASLGYALAAGAAGLLLVVARWLGRR